MRNFAKHLKNEKQRSVNSHLIKTVLIIHCHKPQASLWHSPLPSSSGHSKHYLLPPLPTHLAPGRTVPALPPALPDETLLPSLCSKSQQSPSCVYIR